MWLITRDFQSSIRDFETIEALAKAAMLGIKIIFPCLLIIAY